MSTLKNSIRHLVVALSFIISLLGSFAIYAMGRPSIDLAMGNNEIIVEIDIDCERCYLHEQASLQGFLTFYNKNGGEPKIIPVDELIDVPPYTRVRKSMSLVRIPTYHPYSRVKVDVTLSGDDVGLFSTKRVQSQISRIYPLQ